MGVLGSCVFPTLFLTIESQSRHNKIRFFYVIAQHYNIYPFGQIAFLFPM